MTSLLPKTITFVRHGESTYNLLAKEKENDPLYQELCRSYNACRTSRKTRRRAREMQKKLAQTHGDHDTPLTDEGARQAKVTGERLALTIPKPDIIFCSPYIRTRDTLTHLCTGWAGELEEVETIFDELLVEQNYGSFVHYGDWRIFQALNPNQKDIRDRMGEYWFPYPQGESRPDVRLRAEIFKQKYSSAMSGKNVLIVSHHRWILSHLANEQNFSPEKYLLTDKENPPINCGVTTYKNIDNQLRLESYNKQLWE